LAADGANWAQELDEKRYDALLKGAGNHSVADAAALMGINVRDQAFWETSLESIARDIEHFVQMAEKR